MDISSSSTAVVEQPSPCCNGKHRTSRFNQNKFVQRVAVPYCKLYVVCFEIKEKYINNNIISVLISQWFSGSSSSSLGFYNSQHPEVVLLPSMGLAP